MNRRSFLSSILAAGAAPAICNVEWLMRGSGVIVPSGDRLINGRLCEWDVTEINPEIVVEKAEWVSIESKLDPDRYVIVPTFDIYSRNVRRRLSWFVGW